MWKWRPYQLDCFEAIVNGFKEGKNSQLVIQATGLGKRSQAVFVANMAKKSLFLAHNEELIDQAIEDFSERYGFMNVGIIKGNKMELDKRFVVASPQTIYNRLSKIPKDTFSLVQIDEVHRYMAKTFYQSVLHFNARRIGWTATPRRLDGLSLMDLCENKIFEYNIIDGINDKYLCELDGIRIKTEIGIDSVGKRFGDFNEAQLSNVVDCPQRNKLIVDSYEKYAKGRQFIAFCVDTKHAINLRSHFIDRGYNVDIISSDENICPDRKLSTGKFKSGKTLGLINVKILVEGFDYSDVGAVLNATPTQSETFYLQTIGRGTRKKSQEFISKFGADDCKIIDFVDNSSKHKLVNSFELDKQKTGKSKVFVSAENREKIINAEYERANRTIHSKVEKDSRINLMELPPIKIFSFSTMHDDATEKQLMFLKNLGIYEENDEFGQKIAYTKLMATELINSAPVDAYMHKKLMEWGFNPNGATVGQFMMVREKNKIKERINGNRFMPK